MNIWFDIDGVLDDFKSLADTIQKDRGDNIPTDKLPKHEWEKRNAFWMKMYKEYPTFWCDLQKTKGIDKLVNFVKQQTDIGIGVISNLPVKNTLPKEYIKQITTYKKDWLQKHFPNTFSEIIITEKDKYHFVKGHDILIDDRILNIKDWIKHGGIGILFKTPTQSLKELKEHLSILKNS